MSTDDGNNKATSHNKKYEKFLNDIYTCIKEKEYTRRAATPECHTAPMKNSHKESALGLSTVDELVSETRPIKVTAIMKGSKFKNFLSALDEQQRKISLNNMNLLGLEVKKVSYCEKERKKGVKNIIDGFVDNDNTSLRDDGAILKRTINCETTDQFTCRRMGMSHRDMKVKNIMSRRHSFRTKQKPRSSKSEYKKRGSQDFQNPVYDNRINGYKELIFKLQFIHGLYVETEKDLQEGYIWKSQKKYKAWVGLGNNGQLIKGLLKRRFWWSVSDEKSLNVNFIWTQLKNVDFLDKQEPAPLWVKDSTQLWGKESVMSIASQSSKRFPSRGKRKSIKEEAQTLQEQMHYKIMVEDDDSKIRRLGAKLEGKTYQDRRALLQLPELENEGFRVHNHLSNNFYLGNKKALFYNLKQYYELIGENAFTKIPLTFHIKKGFKDIQYKRFVAYYKRRQAGMKKPDKEGGSKMRNVWIVKPGELTNRGNGITVIDQVYELNQIMKQEGKHENGAEKTFIVQLYLDRPMLYQRRKFDIRHFLLVTHINGLMRAYWFKEGYIRTASYEFDIENFEREIHLTNDAVQKHCPLYGRYEPANKISYAEFQRYLDVTYPKQNYNFQSQMLPQMKSICLDAVKSSYLKLSPKRLKHNFEIFGLDFMIDDSFKPWLIEINTNPCLEIPCPLLARILPQMLDQALRLSLDVVFPPPCHYPNTCKHLAPEASLQNLNYELIFDEKRDGLELRTLYKKSADLMEEIGQISEDETYQDDGKDISLDQLL